MTWICIITRIWLFVLDLDDYLDLDNHNTFICAIFPFSPYLLHLTHINIDRKRDYLVQEYPEYLDLPVLNIIPGFGITPGIDVIPSFNGIPGIVLVTEFG